MHDPCSHLDFPCWLPRRDRCGGRGDIIAEKSGMRADSATRFAGPADVSWVSLLLLVSYLLNTLFLYLYGN